MEQKPHFYKERLQWKDSLGRILIFVIFAGFLVVMLNRSAWSGYALPQFEGTRGYAEPFWEYRQEDTILEPTLTTPAFRHMETGKTYSISTRLTYDGSRDPVPTCFFFVDHMFCRVTLDGEQLMTYTPADVQKRDLARSPGNVYVSVQLPRDCQGRRLTIEFIPALSEKIEFQLPNPTFGNFYTQAVHTFWEELPHNIVVILSGFLGVAAVLFSTLVLPKARYKEGLFIGIFATLFSLYNITESDFDFYAISNPYYTYLLDYTTFTLIPLFLMAFLRERMDPKQRPIATGILILSSLLFIVEMTLHFTGLVDTREFLTILHCAYFLFFLIFFVMMVTMKKNKWKTQLILQMIPILCGAVIDATVYYQHWQLGSSDSTFTAIGVLIFLIAELCHVWQYSMEIYTESIRSQNYRRMAYVDALTGVGNRRAYDMEKNAIAANQRKLRTMVVASADINNLKPTNDTLGHAAGDFLIRSAANVLADFCGDSGSVFRTGGDEFMAFLYDINDLELEKRLEALHSQIDAINSNSETKLSLAMGHERCSRSQMDTAIRTADRKMYENKAAIKAGTATPIGFPK